MKIIALTCPKCHANLEVDSDRKKVFCQYCGTPIFIDDEVQRTEHTFRTIDDAKIEKIKADHEIKLKEFEQQEKNDKDSLKFLLLMFLLAVFFFAVGYIGDNWNSVKTFINEIQGMIRVENPNDYKGENYEIVVTKLENLGFSNITTIEIGDAGLFKKKGDVVDISFNGITNFKKGDMFKPKDKIIITYH